MMKERLIEQVEYQLADIHNADCKELGEAVDMIKDLAETIYYCTVTEAMEGKGYAGERYYTEKYPYHPEKDWDREWGRPPEMMYYNGDGRGSNGGGNNDSSMNGGTRYYTEREYPFELHDEREGRSPARRRKYMEAKEGHGDETHRMKELENYMQELTTDIAEMIKDASPGEKQLLQKKISSLAQKIEQLNA